MNLKKPDPIGKKLDGLDMLIKRICLIIAVLSMTISVTAQQKVRLESIGFANLPGDSIEIQLGFNATPPDPSSFVLDNPARISLDLIGVESMLTQQRYNIDSNNAQSVMVLDDGSRTRLVVNLDQLVNYQSSVVGNQLVLRVGNDAGNLPAAAVSPSQQTDSSSSSNAITNVTFRRGSGNNEGQVVIQLAGDQIIGSVEQIGARVYVEFSNTSVPADLNRRFDVTDFATQVSTVDVLGQSNRATVVIDVNGAYEYVAYQSGNEYTVSVRPPVIEVQGDNPIAAYTGAVMGLTFQDIEITSVLQILADEYDFNLVASPSVQGTITLRLQNVPWDQALQTVLRAGNLDSRLTGNVLYVAPADEIAAQDQMALDANVQAQAQAPLYTEFVQINYADAGDILALLTESGGGASAGGAAVAPADGAASAPAAGGSGGILSVRGGATVDARTNIIIVRDVEEKLEEVRALVAKLDVSVRQVLIEARIVNVATAFGRELGVRWGGAGRDANPDNYLRYGGSLDSNLEQSNNQVAESIARQEALNAGESAYLAALQDGTDPSLTDALVQEAINAVSIPVGSISFPQALLVDLGVLNSNASSFAIGFTNNSALIELELSALESSGNGELIARPKVVTQDKVTAIIASGQRIPYQSQAGGTAGGSTTEFQDAVLSLEVTPQITPDGRIIMDLHVIQDSVVAGSGAIPAINTNSITTSVLVDDGETIVLGGVFREESTLTETKTPLLGDIPYLGNLFKRTESSNRRTELLIFITPTIINDLRTR